MMEIADDQLVLLELVLVDSFLIRPLTVSKN